MSVFTAKVLAEGQLPAAKGTLYTVPASTKAYVRKIFLYNDGAAVETILIYLKPSSTSRKVRRFVLAVDEGAEIADILLEAADLIEGETTNATSVNYVIEGVEET